MRPQYLRSKTIMPASPRSSSDSTVLLSGSDSASVPRFCAKVAPDLARGPRQPLGLGTSRPVWQAQPPIRPKRGLSDAPGALGEGSPVLMPGRFPTHDGSRRGVDPALSVAALSRTPHSPRPHRVSLMANVSCVKDGAQDLGLAAIRAGRGLGICSPPHRIASGCLWKPIQISLSSASRRTALAD